MRKEKFLYIFQNKSLRKRKKNMKNKFSSHLMVQQKKNYSQEIFNKRKCYIRKFIQVLF